jgi:hypothetical protein
MLGNVIYVINIIEELPPSIAEVAILMLAQTAMLDFKFIKSNQIIIENLFYNITNLKKIKIKIRTK